MAYDPARHHRRSIRLPGYDYSREGAYFVTLCSAGRACIFGQVIDGGMHLSAAGEIVAEEWRRSADLRRELRLDAFVVMPNHIHGIVFIGPLPGGAPLRETPRAGLPVGRPPAQADPGTRRLPRSLSSFIAGFKSSATSRINAMRGTPGEPVWQRNYYEHIVRSAAALERIRRYIATNPARWQLDSENPAREGTDPFETWLASA